MRGKEMLHDAVLAVHRITPAHAGKSAALAVSAIRLGDHPRACGEKTKKIP